MSDSEGDWQPNGRPQSTLARSFSAALNDAFMIDSDLDGLSNSVEQKKKVVSSASQELEALEARLRETEELLKKRQTGSASRSPAATSGRNSPHRRTPLGAAFSPDAGKESTPPTSPLSRQQPTEAGSRPVPVKESSYNVPPMPGRLPPTPGEGGRNDYVMVDKTGNKTSEGVDEPPQNTNSDASIPPVE